MWGIYQCVRPQLRPSVRLNGLPDFYEIRYRRSLQNVLEQARFTGEWLGVSHTLLKGESEFLLVMSVLIDEFR